MLPKSTTAMFKPMSIVLIKREGLLLKPEIIFADKEPFSFKSSTRSLLADTKAISMPEKKAISNKAINIENTSIQRMKVGEKQEN